MLSSWACKGFALVKNSLSNMDMNEKKENMRTGIYLVLLLSFIFAFVPNFAKMAADTGASLFFLLFSRFAIGVAVLIPILHWSKERPYQLTKKQGCRVALSGSFAFALIAFTYRAIEFLDVGMVMIVLYCFPVGWL